MREQIRFIQAVEIPQDTPIVMYSDQNQYLCDCASWSQESGLLWYTDTNLACFFADELAITCRFASRADFERLVSQIQPVEVQAPKGEKAVYVG